MNSAATALRAGFDGLLGLVFPMRCCLCDTFCESSLCDRCASPIPRPIPEPTCPRCGHHRNSLPCSECLADPPYFVIALAAGDYSGELQEAIHWLKYRDRPMLAEPLGRILAAHARRNSGLLAGLQFDCIVPTPLHATRRRVRGYNQAERLARVVARDLDLPLRTDLLRRVRATPPQVGLGGDARRGNLAGAFRAQPDAAGLTILLVDDVSTTGATLRECAQTLKEAGADAVYCISLGAG